MRCVLPTSLKWGLAVGRRRGEDSGLRPRAAGGLGASATHRPVHASARFCDPVAGEQLARFDVAQCLDLRLQLGESDTPRSAGAGGGRRVRPDAVAAVWGTDIGGDGSRGGPLHGSRGGPLHVFTPGTVAAVEAGPGRGPAVPAADIDELRRDPRAPAPAAAWPSSSPATPSRRPPGRHLALRTCTGARETPVAPPARPHPAHAPRYRAALRRVGKVRASALMQTFGAELVGNQRTLSRTKLACIVY